MVRADSTVHPLVIYVSIFPISTCACASNIFELSVDATETVRAVIGPQTKSFPESLFLTLKARGVSVVTESDYIYI